MKPGVELLNRMLNQKVVVDLVSPYVAIGTLAEADDKYLKLEEADLHDLREARTTREQYVVDAKLNGIRVNRRAVLLRMDEVVGVGALDDVVA